MNTQQTAKSKNQPTTIKGAWQLVIKVMNENGITAGVPSLKEYARGQAGRSDSNDPIVKDAKRWLQSKRPGGTDEDRARRRTKRKDQRALRSMSSGKSSLSSQGSGKKRK